MQAPPLPLTKLQAESLGKVLQAAHIIADLAPSSRSTLLSVNVAVAARHHAQLTNQLTAGGPAAPCVPRTEVRSLLRPAWWSLLPSITRSSCVLLCLLRRMATELVRRTT